MIFTNGAGLASAVTEIEAQKKNGTSQRRTSSSSKSPLRKVWSLHRARFLTPVVRVVPDDDSPLYRVAWPDIGLSPAANLARCRDAAHAWAERNAVTEDRKINAARRLKSLSNFSWSSSLVRQSGRAGIGHRLPGSVAHGAAL